MNKPRTAGKGEERHPYGPRHVGALLPRLTRPAFARHAPASASLLADWPSIVGPQLAAVTQPRRIAAATLTLGCTGPVALELQHMAGPLIERVNTHLGRAQVKRLRFVQDAPPPAPPPAPGPAPRLEPVAIEGLPPGGLHDALAALGARVRSERA